MSDLLRLPSNSPGRAPLFSPFRLPPLPPPSPLFSLPPFSSSLLLSPSLSSLLSSPPLFSLPFLLFSSFLPLSFPF
ncbi:hypothetical protein ACXWRS_11700, partial [Streptococcus pyogenes]